MHELLAIMLLFVGQSDGSGTRQTGPTPPPSRPSTTTSGTRLQMPPTRPSTSESPTVRPPTTVPQSSVPVITRQPSTQPSGGTVQGANGVSQGTTIQPLRPGQLTPGQSSTTQPTNSGASTGIGSPPTNPAGQGGGYVPQSSNSLQPPGRSVSGNWPTTPTQGNPTQGTASGSGVQQNIGDYSTSRTGQSTTGPPIRMTGQDSSGQYGSLPPTNASQPRPGGYSLSDQTGGQAGTGSGSRNTTPIAPPQYTLPTGQANGNAQLPPQSAIQRDGSGPTLRASGTGNTGGQLQGNRGASLPVRSSQVYGDTSSQTGLTPAGSTHGVQAAPPAGLSTTATEIIERGLFGTPYGSDGLDGTPVRLVDVVPSTGDRQARLNSVRAYWQLTVSVADYHFAAEELRWLASLPQPATARDRTVLNAAIASADARSRETRLAVLNYQHELAQGSNANSASRLPLPLDAPFIGRYQTHYEAYARARTLPSGLGKIDQALPLMLDLISARARSTEANLALFLDSAQRYEAGRGTASEVVASFVQARDQRLALLAAVRDYNQLIAEYAIAVGPSTASPSRVVAMLIATTSDNDGSRQAMRDESLMRQTSADQAPTISPTNYGVQPGYGSSAYETQSPYSGGSVQGAPRSVNQGWSNQTQGYPR